MAIMHISDLHLGVKRSTGTTLDSRAQLHKHMMREFERLLSLAQEGGHDLLINGDLFDTFNVDREVEFQVFRLLRDWCHQNPSSVLVMSAGNHDLSRDNSVVSSFHIVARYLEITCNNVTVITDGLTALKHDIWVIPHMPNQEMFDEQLEACWAVAGSRMEGGFLFLHANYDNFFARESDHSLNVSAEMAERFKQVGVKLVFAHEHQQKETGNVIVVGNQIASSVSDCLGNTFKRYILVYSGEKEVVSEPFWDVSDVNFAKVDWRKNPEDFTDVKFIRLTGDATAEESVAVVNQVIRWRKTLGPNTFVITNAVKIAAMEVTVGKLESGATNFNVLQLVRDRVPKALKSKFEQLENLLGDHNV